MHLSDYGLSRERGFLSAFEIDEITLLVGGGEGQHSVLMPTFHTPRPVLASPPLPPR